MELRQLRYFKSIADAHSFVRGSHFLRVAQPALSRSIASLEEEIGQLLFVRHNGGVSLTDAGTRFYEHATEVLRRMQVLSDDMAAEMGAPFGAVALGMPASLQSVLATPIAASFLTKYPRVTLNLVQNTSVNLRFALSAGQLDVAVVLNAAPSCGLHYTPLLTEPKCLIQPIDSGLSHGDSIEISDLIGMPLILCGYPNSIRSTLENEFSKFSAKPDIRCEVNTSSLAIELVEAGVGASIVPGCAIASKIVRNFRVTPINGLACSWAIATSFERVGTASVTQLSNMIQDYASEWIGSGGWPPAQFGAVQTDKGLGVN